MSGLAYSTRYRIRRFLISECGGVVLWVAVTLPIMVGTLAMAIEAGQIFALNTDLQKHASAAAIAGAAELNGVSGARSRADAAARFGLQGTLQNEQRFASDGGGPLIGVQQIVFLRRLPADGTAFVAGDVATSDADARFIYVRVDDRTIDNSMSRIIAGAISYNTGADAIAGYSQVVCKFPALMVCNPFEDPTLPVDPACSVVPGQGASFDPDCMRGRQVLMKTKGGSGQWQPGNFGLVENPDGSNGAPAVADLLANAAPNFCVGSRVDPNTGSVTGPVKAAINVRFDLYENPMFGGASNDPQYRPALNVTKGYVDNTSGNNCDGAPLDPPDPNTAMALPRDDCFQTGTCPGGSGGRFGDGNWDRTGYWNTNHPGDAQPPGYASMSRFGAYRYEIENNLIPDNSGLTPTGENGNPQCYSGGQYSDPTQDADETGSDEIDRRVLVMAAVNCVENNFNGTAGPLPVIAFIKMFLTEPVAGSSDFDIWGEIVDVIQPSDQGGVLKDIVQLYR